eukprot:TRINITY_DN59906_c0_g1_i1.p1 TRINITY_DN59906_c0_g1~~TRINITY_DN59906_c0_g1_i1.p1  ORF type:complete len:148 (-),score=35.06 TRINITY_DN59906_c0_g1_i1:192-635(-)
MGPMASEAHESLVSIRKQEEALQTALEGPVSAYYAAVQEHSSAKDKYEELNMVVESCATSLAEVSEQLDGAKDSLSEHTGSMDDNSSVVRMKQGLTQIKRETKDLDLQLGITRSRLSVLAQDPAARAIRHHSKKANSSAGMDEESLD